MNAPLTYSPETSPPPGTAVGVAPGIEWLCMPLPFALNHINLWLLADKDEAGEGYAAVDTGISTPEVRAAWDQVLLGRRLTRAIVTHLHPDHVGLAGWLQREKGAPLWMSQGDYLTARMICNDATPFSVAAMIALFRRHGLGEDSAAAFAQRGNAFKKGVSDLPETYRQLFAGDVLNIGKHAWRTIVGYGHAAEHMSLYCDELHVLISGDMLLPRISTNISVQAPNPDGNPLKLFLDSIDAFLDLPQDTLVLPSHGRPFRGLHGRVADLHAHHAGRCAVLLKACKGKAASAAELITTLFDREFTDPHQTMFAMGEAIAHLNYLMHAGSMRRVERDGLIRFIS